MQGNTQHQTPHDNAMDQRNVIDVRYTDAHEKALGESFSYASEELFGDVKTDEVYHWNDCVRQRQLYSAGL
jgi:hypothetical protein